MDEHNIIPELKEYARINEQEIKRAVVDFVKEYLESSTLDTYEAKFDEGTREHGPLTEELLKQGDWQLHACAEAKDLFWYLAMENFRSHLNCGEE